MVHVSAPSRICLFGEHQDYLGLEVIAAAVNMRFTASARPRADGLIRVKIRDESVSELGDPNAGHKYQHIEIDMNRPIVYETKRDYFKSAVRVLRDELYQSAAQGQSDIQGLYPCGEGAGYAGGIVSAAVDGLRCAYAVMRDASRT